MIEKTVFNDKTIKKVIKENYNIDVTNIEKLERGSANLYSLNNNQYILKEFQSKYTQSEINKEIAIINHLKNDGMLVPEYIITLEKQYSFIYEGKIVILQKFIDGYTMESNTGTYEQMLESARELGKIVKSLTTFSVELPITDVTTWYSFETINESIQKHKELIKKASGEYKEKIVKDLNDKISMLENIKNNIDFKEMKYVTCMNTHGDYSVLQFIYNETKIKAIIDFVSACKMPIIWEVIRSYSYIDKDAKNGEINIDNLVDYVKEFNKYVKLNKFDIKYMPYVYLIQLLTSTFGYKQYINNHSNKALLEFGFFRTELCKNLYTNAELISKRLINSINVN